MKRTIALILAALIIFALCACTAGQTANEPADSTQPSASPTAEPSTEPSTEPSEQPVETPEADKYQYLDEFVSIINSISDPPELESDDEYDAYYKSLFDEWKAGNIFTFITEDENGAPTVEDHTEDFVGKWRDSYSQRAEMEITSDNGIYYNVVISWANSAFEVVKWYFTGTYNPQEKAIEYSSGMCELESTTDDPADGRNLLYEDGDGFIRIDGDTLLWQDNKENAGENCVFEREQ